jgi:hypothetical protein
MAPYRRGRCQCLLEKLQNQNNIIMNGGGDALEACPNDSLEGSAFCEFHQDKCDFKSPMSGYEPKYDSNLWNNKKERRETHNCFAYAMNIIDIKQIIECLTSPNCDGGFHQPGAASGREGFKSANPKTCPDMLTRILGDNPTIERTTFLEQCPARTSKIALVVDEDEDYHFLRQDSDGWWSQKGGAKPVVKVDASDRPIWNPELADHNWTNENGVLDYDIFCGYMCVPRKSKLKITVGGKRKTKKRAAPRAPQAKRYHRSQTKRYRGRKA